MTERPAPTVAELLAERFGDPPTHERPWPRRPKRPEPELRHAMPITPEQAATNRRVLCDALPMHYEEVA